MMRAVFLCLIVLFSGPPDNSSSTTVQAFVRPSTSIAMATNNHHAATTTTSGGGGRVTAVVAAADLLRGGTSSWNGMVVRPRAGGSWLAATTGNNNNGSILETVMEAAERTVRIVQQSQRDGAGVKQILANVLAGDGYDVAAVHRVIDQAIGSAPVVLFTWAASPSCRQAIRALDLMGVENYKIVRLDDPWDQGNAIRAQLGVRQQGKCSVPAIYIGGEYIGGYDSGIGPDRPGLVDLALMGVLPERMRQAGVSLVASPAVAAVPVVTTTTTTSSNAEAATTMLQQ